MITAHSTSLTPRLFISLLGDTTRFTVLLTLKQHGELCVCDLTGAMQVSQPKLSRHLARLRRYGILRTRRHQQWMYYSIHPALPHWGHAILEELLRADPLPVIYSPLLRSSRTRSDCLPPSRSNIT